MDDFHQIHQVPELATAMPSTSGKRHASSAGAAVQSITRWSAWKCKNGDGEVTGPVPTETLKMWWDYEQINEDTMAGPCT